MPAKRVQYLDVPHVASVAGDVTALEGLSDVFGIADRAASGIDDPGSLLTSSLVSDETTRFDASTRLLHVAERLFVDQIAGLLVKRAVDSAANN